MSLVMRVVSNRNISDWDRQETKISTLAAVLIKDVQEQETKQDCQSADCTSKTTTSLDSHTRDDYQDEPEDAFDDIENHNRFEAVPFPKSFHLLGTDHVGVEYK